jgi:hypothetical protein
MPVAVDVGEHFHPFLRRELRVVIRDVATKHRSDQVDFKTEQSGEGFNRFQTNLKTRFNCVTCRQGHQQRTWTSSRGVAVIVYKTKRLGPQNYEVDFNIFIYGSRCLRCSQLGDMKAYEDEVERVCEVMTKNICESLGYRYPKEIRTQRVSRPVNRRGH